MHDSQSIWLAYICLLFSGFQMSTISRVFRQQLWNVAVLLILTSSFSWWG